MQRFNKQKPLPDVQKEEWNACSTVEGIPQGEIGVISHGERVNDFIEKQVIYFYKHIFS